MDKILNPLDLGQVSSTPSNPASGYLRIYAKTNGQFYGLDASGKETLLSADTFTIPFIIDGGGSVITTGSQGGFYIPFGYTLIEWTMASIDPLTISGSIVVDLWTDTQANFPPTVADSITASAKPTITTDTKAQSSTLTGWTINQAAGRWIYANVDSVTSLKKVALNLKCIKV